MIKSFKLLYENIIKIYKTILKSQQINMLARYSSLSLFIIFYILPHYIKCWCKQSQFSTSKQIKAMDTSPGGRFVAVGHSDKYVRLYHSKNYGLITEISYNDNINVVRFSPDGHYLGVGTDDKWMYVHNGYQNFAQVKALDAGFNNIAGLDWASDSSKIVGCGGTSGNGRIVYFNISTWNSTSQNINPSSSLPVDCRVSGFNNLIAVSTGSRIAFYNFEISLVPPNATNGSSFDKLVWNPNAYNLLYLSNTNRFNFLNSGIVSTTVLTSKSTDNLQSLDFDIGGRYSAVGGKQRILYIFNSQNKKISQWTTNTDLTDEIRSVVFSKTPDQLKLFVGHLSGQILVLSLNCSKNCPSQYYYSGSTCIQCPISLSYCLQCINGSACDTCIQGYYVDPSSFTCKNCSKLGCLTCLGPAKCTQCCMGFYLHSSRKCNRCDFNNTGCIICSNQTNCIVCDSHYFLNSNTNKCEYCSANISNCLKCYNSSFCQQCKYGYYTILNVTYTINGTNGTNLTLLMNSTNSTNITNITNLTICARCDYNCLFCQKSPSNCSQCTKGYYINNYICTPCNSNCISCNQSNYCFQCLIGMYQLTNGTCQECPYPCLNCQNDTKCFFCFEGYYLSNNSCLPCAVNNCAICNISTYCASCLPGFYLLANNTCRLCSQQYTYCEYCSGSICQSCQLGYYFNGTSCLYCGQTMFKCQKCLNLTTCVSCLQGFYLTNLTGNSSCTSCNLGCQICNDSLDCIKCFLNYYLDGNYDCILCPDDCIECLNSTLCLLCQIGYFVDSNDTCVHCSTNISNCLECWNGSACANCQIGYYLNTSDRMCQTCPDNCLSCSSNTTCFSCVLGYYLTTGASQSCQACSLQCTQCSSALICSSCKVGYWLNSTSKKCKKCTQNNKYCRTCNNATCFSCIYGYFLDNSTSSPNFECTSCLTKIQGCIHCNTSDYCISCDFGYYLDSNTIHICTSCTQIPGCQLCSNSSYCDQCIAGFSLNLTTYQCEICQLGCSTCDSNGSCFTCNPGFYLNGQNCSTCNVFLQGCGLCSNTSACVQCMNGYYLGNETDSTCNFCRAAMIGCLYCNTSSICTKCQPGFYLNTTMDQCQICTKTLQGCQICTTGAICSDCSTGYYLTSGSGCTLCIASLVGCVSCTDNSTCQLCKTGFYLNSTDYQCYACYLQNDGCQSCYYNSSNSSIVCQQCSAGTYLLAANSLCSGCQTIGCQICLQSNSSICISCDTLYYKNGSQCSKCSEALTGCSVCTNGTACQICDVGYYLSPGNQTCLLCQTAMLGCGKCQFTNTTLQCTSCKSSFLLNTTSNTSCNTCFQIMQGCSYCTNTTQCISCGNGYFKNSTTGLCQTCTSIDGCLLCSNQTHCQYCTSSYWLNITLNQCIKCSITMPFCLTCIVSTVCISCQNGYQANADKCDPVTAAATQQVQGMKLITQYISKDILSHTLYVKNSQQTNTNLNLNGMCKLYLTDYGELKNSNLSLRQIKQLELEIKGYQWIASNKLQFYTNNPTNLSQQGPSGMSMFSRRLLGQTTSNLQNFKVSLQINQIAANSIFPNLYQTDDLIVDYSLDEPQFYMSYLKNSGNSKAINYSIFGYLVTFLMVANYIYRTYKLKSSAQLNNHSIGELLSHIFAIKTITMTYYPITYQFYYFCYGFMLFDFPWLNLQIGRALAQRYDYAPKQFIMYYYNLNIACTFLIAFLVFIVLIITVRYLINKNNELRRNKYTQLIYSIFIFGLAYSGSAALQGALYNPIVKFNLNGLFYLIGIFIYIGVFIEILYSLREKKQNFYKMRIFVKGSMLSIGHVNPVIVVPICVATDLLLLFLQYKVIEMENVKIKQEQYKVKIWLMSNFLLDAVLLILFLLPNSFASLIMTMLLVSTVLIIQLLLTFTNILQTCCKRLQQNISNKYTSRSKKINNKINDSPQSHELQRFNFSPQDQKNLRNQSLQTLINDNNNRSIMKFNVWDMDKVKNNVPLDNIAEFDEKVDNVRKEFNKQYENTKYSSLSKKGFNNRNKKSMNNTNNIDTYNQIFYNNSNSNLSSNSNEYQPNQLSPNKQNKNSSSSSSQSPPEIALNQRRKTKQRQKSANQRIKKQWGKGITIPLQSLQSIGEINHEDDQNDYVAYQIDQEEFKKEYERPNNIYHESNVDNTNQGYSGGNFSQMKKKQAKFLKANNKPLKRKQSNFEQ